MQVIQQLQESKGIKELLGALLWILPSPQDTTQHEIKFLAILPIIYWRRTYGYRGGKNSLGGMLRLGSLCHFQNWDQLDDHEKKKPIFALGLNVKNQAGFTLIEIIAVLVILSVVGAITFTKAEALSESATLSVIEDAIRELNSREMVTWANVKLSDQGWIDDPTLFGTMDVDLGAGFRWTPRADLAGGKLHFKDMAVRLTREPSQYTSSGRWKISG